MDDRSANVLKHTDSFAADDALLSVSGFGDSLFVINLCAANVPQNIDAHSVEGWGIGGLARYKLYQVSRMEDGRRRYRVRLGFFTSEADAEIVLQSVRGKFATAFSSGLADEDLKHACGYLKKPLHEIQEIQDVQRTGRYRLPTFTEEQLAGDVSPYSKAKTAMPAPPAARVAVETVVRQITSSHAQIQTEDTVVEFEWTPAAKADAPSKSQAAANTNASTKLSAYIAAHKAATKADATATPQKSPAAPIASLAKKNEHYHVAAGRDIPDHGLSLSDDVPALRADTTTNSLGMKSAATKPVATPPASTPKPAELPRPLLSADALAKLRAASLPRQQASIIPTLDSTQTIRTLTKTEIEDANAPKWYVVQLAVSDQPANLETMPRLDIFEAYRLYSIARMEGTIIKHTLRLGFFKEQVSAEAVMGYLKTFFGEPRIERVSDAEQKRFIDPPAPKPAAAVEMPKTQQRVITLEEKRGARSVGMMNSAPAIGAIPPKPAPKPAPNRIASKYAAPAVKRATQSINARKPLANKTHGKSASGKYAHLSAHERGAITEARLLGLSDTAIRRVEHNPSLLSRLVGKLTK
jgi:hypothetical protein